MSDPFASSRRPDSADASDFDALVSAANASASVTFATAFRGYDRDEVDATVAKLTTQLQARTDEAAQLEERFRRAAQATVAQSRKTVERLEADLAASDTAARKAQKLLAQEQATVTAAQESIEKLQSDLDAATAGDRDELNRLRAELATANARAATAEQQVQALSDELVGGDADSVSANRRQFEEVLHVAEEQAGVLIRNATVQGDRLLEAAREEIAARRKESQAEADAVMARAQHDAQQVRLRIDTELTAHQAQLDRESAHATEKVAQAEQEAAAIRSEAEKGAAALRSMVSRETTRDRAEAEQTVRELRVRALEFEESLTRRQDDAQQEFLVLHNQAVAHAERITLDANEQVAASLDHAQRVSTKADDFEKLMRAQAQQIEADARIRAREHLDRARDKAERIIDTVTAHSQAVLRDAEDRTRALRWQQHQLTSFMAEVKELIRPETPLGAGGDGQADAVDAVLEDAAQVVDAVEVDADDAADESRVEDGPAEEDRTDEDRAEADQNDGERHDADQHEGERHEGERHDGEQGEGVGEQGEGVGETESELESAH